MDGFTLVLEVSGDAVESRKVAEPPLPIMPALRGRVPVKVKRRVLPVVVETTGEALS